MVMDETIQMLREAVKDRGLYLALLIRSFSKVLPAQTVERCAREAIREYGRYKAKLDGWRITPEMWVDRHMEGWAGAVFESTIIKQQGRCEQQMTFCPLLEAWRELGCTWEEMDLLCDIAMEVDRGRAEAHGISAETPERMGKGDDRCRLILLSSD
jgi:hypothetical protein